MVNEWGDADLAPKPSSAITPSLLDAVKHVESRGNVNAVSPAGARGPYQFMPATAREMGLANPHDEPTAREAASRYLTQLSNKFGGDVDKALLAYNWGPGNVERHLKTGGPMPLEAQQYVGKVRAAEQKMSGTTRTPVMEWSDEDVAPATLAERVTKPTSAPTMGSQFMKGVGDISSAPEVVAHLGTGMLGQAVGGLAGLAGTVLPGPEGQGAKWSVKVGNALTY